MVHGTGGIQRADDGAIRVGRRLLILPSRQAASQEIETIPLLIDPEGAFGSGTHPTTQLCLRALERHLTQGDSVLDLGAGAGTLAIAAAKLGAERVLALDNDPESVRVARRNVAANRLDETIQVEHASLAELLAGQFAMVQARVAVVNILANVIVGFFASGLTDAVEPGGLLILSGMLRSQTPEINACVRRADLELLAQEKQDDWVCLIARKTFAER